MPEPMLPRGIRNNNPGNLRPNPAWKWDGQGPMDTAGGQGEYLTFISPEYGIRAMIRDIRSKRKRGLDTVQKIMNVYAPLGDNNNPVAYARSVCARIGAMLEIELEPNDPMPTDMREFRVAFAKAKVRVENGSPASFGRTEYWYADWVYAKAADMEDAS